MIGGRGHCDRSRSTQLGNGSVYFGLGFEEHFVGATEYAFK
jgi:hypothetical protein